MRPQDDIDAAEANDRTLDHLEKKGRAGADFVLAIRTARQVTEQAGLNAISDENGRAHFTVEQTAKAVRHTREDAAASLMLQLFVMRRLDRNRNYMWVIITLLLYIASQFKY